MMCSRYSVFCFILQIAASLGNHYLHLHAPSKSHLCNAPFKRHDEAFNNSTWAKSSTLWDVPAATWCSPVGWSMISWPNCTRRGTGATPTWRQTDIKASSPTLPFSGSGSGMMCSRYSVFCFILQHVRQIIDSLGRARCHVVLARRLVHDQLAKLHTAWDGSDTYLEANGHKSIVADAPIQWVRQRHDVQSLQCLLLHFADIRRDSGPARDSFRIGNVFRKPPIAEAKCSCLAGLSAKCKLISTELIYCYRTTPTQGGQTFADMTLAFHPRTRLSAPYIEKVDRAPRGAPGPSADAVFSLGGTSVGTPDKSIKLA
ncbi:hypothetical protein MRX96_022312 [Rhipicephalus microplus]